MNKDNIFSKSLLFAGALSSSMISVSCNDNNSAADNSVVLANNNIEKPNIVYIVIDDMGFSDLGCYGSEISTPNIDKLAENGLRYNNFCVTPLSSPTRAALLSGRNSHSVGMGRLANYTLDLPHSTAQITNTSALTPRVLKDNNYNTYAVGKWHVAPLWETSSIGPYNNWPLGRGFDKFYGFMDGETDQFNPELVDGNTHVDTVYDDNYHLTEDITDRAIYYIKSHKSISKEKPFMLYYATGAAHSPHQVPEEYVKKYENVYNVGWDKIRESRLKKQKELGIVPMDAELSPLNENVKPWNELDEDTKRLFIEYEKHYAAFIEHTDAQIGRLIKALEDMGELDNTVIFLIADNGPSPSGKATGTLNTVNIKNGIMSDIEKDVKRINEFSKLAPNYPQGWAQVSATPFRYYKESANYLGGIRVPLIIHYPKGIDKSQNGSIRTQFSFVTDIAKTVSDITGIKEPKTVDSIEQMPLHGYSLVPTFNDANADTKRTTQYFELYGNRGLYDNGYFLSISHKKGDSFDNDNFALYDLNTDFSQLKDISKENESKLKEMKNLWDKEAEKYGVNPLDDRVHVELIAKQLSANIEKKNSLTLYPNTSSINVNISAIPTALNRSYDITAYLNRKSSAEEGVLLAFGNHYGGYSLYIINNKLNYEYIYDDAKYHIEVNEPLPLGELVIKVKYIKTGKDSGEASLLVNNKEVGKLALPKVYPMTANTTDGMSAGRDLQGNVSERYEGRGHFEYSGDLEKVTVEGHNDYNKIAI